MKKILLILVSLSVVTWACNNKGESNSAAAPATGEKSTVNLPYEASYTTDFTSDVPDSDLLVVLNSYKAWENGDMNALRATMGDSMSVNGATGFRFKGLTDSLMKYWSVTRDSMKSVKIDVGVWLKSHAVKDSNNYINVWYRETDSYKDGKVDSANFEDVNLVKNGKVVWYSSYRQALK